MRLTGWRYCAFIGCFFGLIGTQCYFTMISPMLNPDKYRIMQEETRSFVERKTKM